MLASASHSDRNRKSEKETKWICGLFGWGGGQGSRGGGGGGGLVNLDQM